MTDSDRVWLIAPAVLALSDDEVHVWRAFLDLTASSVQSLLCILSADELKRAARFYFQKDRQRFIVAHGLLRVVLSRYLDTEPGRLCFRYNDYGKPSLACVPGQRMLRFSLSHSDGLALYAVSYGREIGIDVERIRPVAGVEQIAKCYFSVWENALLRTFPASLRCRAFFTWWTRKEAYIKARGEGLALPLDQFDVSLVPGGPVMGLGDRWNLQLSPHWALRELKPGPGYVATVAVQGCNSYLTCWQFPALTTVKEFVPWQRVLV